MADLTAPAPVVGVLGASGGLGASTLTVALALSATQGLGSPRRPPVVAVDGVLTAGGLDVTACVEHVDGLRWGDLSGARGEVCGQDLLDELPRAAGVPVLSAAPDAPAPAPEVVASVLEALRSAAALVVVDLERHRGLSAGDGVPPEPALKACDLVLLVAGATPRHLADAVAATGHLAADRRLASRSSEVRLVVRGASRDLASALADHLGLPLAAAWRDDRRVPLDAERGRPPGQVRRSALAALCRQLLEQVADDRAAA
jgi:secretion/DNA translocation related CpaE-like protein